MSSNDSWQQYVDSCLLETNKLSQAAILGHDGAIWASSPNFELSSEEISSLIEAFRDASKARERGLYIAGVRNIILRADSRSIYGKNGASGALFVKTGQTIIVATYGSEHIPGNATAVVEQLADYLISAGF
ncbi:profilin [Mitosporidium daphniae]|uniref:Profilin n=1 Tax=Mitosporidium daphniae TaxID=1485682 RepID=A0A098VU29_9MICR|nr:profilin [Mitosporidium daphniae]KGG52467.1 profilin [Mitosporidium daphniae]|eukprot:XP_013238894.1 profilin [Mitosporidium daphniae]